MIEELDDASAFLLLAAATEPVVAEPSSRQRLLDALERNRYLPFSAELGRLFALPLASMRELLSKIDDPQVWLRGVAPIEGQMDFHPGPSLAPLRGGFVRMQGGMHVPRHRHTDREVTFVLAGELVDDQERRLGPGTLIDMPSGSVHSIGVPEGAGALVALLHGRIEMLGD